MILSDRYGGKAARYRESCRDIQSLGHVYSRVESLSYLFATNE